MSADGNTVTVWPSVRIGAGGGTALTGDAADGLVRTVVDTHLLLPGMFVLTFSDMTGAALTDAEISIGTTMQVWAQAGDDDQARQLISGEVTAIEGRYEYLTGVTIVRGYDLGHRLQRVRRTRTFVNMTDSDIASQIAREGGLPLGGITATSVVHDHLGQCDETDWDFLKHRAREIGYEFGMTDGKFQFRKASSVTRATGEPLTLTLGQNLRLFMPRVTAGNLTPDVEVRVWDPVQARVTAESASASTGTASVTGLAAAALGQKFGLAPEGSGSGAAAEEGAGQSAGPPPSPTAHVISDRPVGSGASASSAATLVASGLAEHLGSTFAEAEADAAGSPKIQAGAVVKTEGVPSQFTGSWVVTNARHIFDLAEGGYHTAFVVSGRHERSLLGLASAGTAQSPPRMPGVVCGIVTNVNDTKGRAKVALPWLSPDYESDWAPVVQFGAGKRSGGMFLPEVGDEVLVGFEFGDARRPYVLGGLVNNSSAYSLGGPAVQSQGETAAVARRGFVSAAGNRLVFHDELPPGGDEGPPTASEITLGTGDSKFRLAIDAVAGTLILACTPDDPPGHLTIQCGNAGTVDIKTGNGGTVNIDGGAALSLKAQESISIQSSAEVTVKGAQIKLN